MTPTPDELATILKACTANGVTHLHLGDLDVTFKGYIPASAAQEAVLAEAFEKRAGADIDWLGTTPPPTQFAAEVRDEE